MDLADFVDALTALTGGGAEWVAGGMVLRLRWEDGRERTPLSAVCEALTGVYLHPDACVEAALILGLKRVDAAAICAVMDGDVDADPWLRLAMLRALNIQVGAATPLGLRGEG